MRGRARVRRCEMGFAWSCSAGAYVTDVARVVGQITVVWLAQLSGDEVEDSVAEFFLMALYICLIGQPQSHDL